MEKIAAKPKKSNAFNNALNKRSITMPAGNSGSTKWTSYGNVNNPDSINVKVNTPLGTSDAMYRKKPSSTKSYGYNGNKLTVNNPFSTVTADPNIFTTPTKHSYFDRAADSLNTSNVYKQYRKLLGK